MQFIVIGLLLLYLGYRFGKKVMRLVFILIGAFVLWKSGILLVLSRFFALFILNIKEAIGL